MTTQNKSIRQEECFDGDFSRHIDCREWMRVFKAYVKSKLDTYEVRIDTYYHDGNLYLTVDPRNLVTNESIAITIVINRHCIDLGNPEDDQQDIALPGLKDAFFFIKSLLSTTDQVLSQQGLWVSLQDKQGVYDGF